MTVLLGVLSVCHVFRVTAQSCLHIPDNGAPRNKVHLWSITYTEAPEGRP